METKRDEELKCDHPRPRKRKNMLQSSKKKDCEAKITMKVQKNTKKDRSAKSQALRKHIESGKEIKSDHRIYIRLPSERDHGNVHQLGQLTGFMNPLSKMVREKLAGLVGEGVSNVAEMRRHLRVFVDSVLFADMPKPDNMNVSYYPTDTTIRKHIYMSQMKLRYSKLDQVNLLHQVTDWQKQSPDDYYAIKLATKVPQAEEIDHLSVEEKEIQKDDDPILSFFSAISQSFKISITKRWVWAYRFGFGLLVNTNNGLERQNKVFKYTYLEEKKNNSLSAMVKILITDYLPAMMLKYVRDNAVSSENFGRRYQTCIPNFLRSRPPIFLKHCMQKMEAALMIDHVKKVEETDSCYQVKSQSDNKKIFNVILDNGKGIPSCECHDWNWTLMPCKHICAVLQSPDVTWDKVARPYMDSPFFTLDMEVVNIPVSGLRVEIGEDLDGDKEMKELPSPKHGPGAIKIAAIQCREKLSLIQNATYLCQNEETLKELNKQLEAASLFINSHLYLEDGLCLEIANKTKHTVSKQQVSQSTKDIRSIKTRKKKGSKTCRMVGNFIFDGEVPTNTQIDEGIASEPSTKTGITKIESEPSPKIQQPASKSILKRKIESTEMKVKKKKVRFSGTQQDGPSIVVLEDKKRESVRIGPPSTVLDSSESKVNIYESCKSPVGYVCAKYDKNNPIFYVDFKICLDMNGDLDDKEKLLQYELIIGAFNEGFHWVLIALYPQRKEVLYLNPLGMNRLKKQKYEKTIRIYLVISLQIV
ncbi:hypothetical protein ScPMuIL_008420 [Solemya velum]